MVMPTAYNPISLGQVQTEFTGTNPIGINEYYRGGGYTTQNNTNVPTSGTISLADFYSAYRQVINTGELLHYFNNSSEEITYNGVQVPAFTNVTIEGTGATFQEVNPGLFIIPPPGLSGTFDIQGRHYVVTWNTPFPNANYIPTIEVLQGGLSAAVQNPNSVEASHWATAYITTTGFKIQFKNNTLNDDNGNFIGAYGFVRAFRATAALV